MSDSKTPRTDKECASNQGYGGHWVSADFARELERENAALRASMDLLAKGTDAAAELFSLGYYLQHQDDKWHIFKPSGDSVNAGSPTLRSFLESLAPTP